MHISGIDTNQNSGFCFQLVVTGIFPFARPPTEHFLQLILFIRDEVGRLEGFGPTPPPHPLLQASHPPLVGLPFFDLTLMGLQPQTNQGILSRINKSRQPAAPLSTGAGGHRGGAAWRRQTAPLTGAEQEYGLRLSRGLRLALDEANAAGGVQGRGQGGSAPRPAHWPTPISGCAAR